MADSFYLGYSDYRPRPHTRISCVAKATGGKWQRVEDLSTDLPPLGKVFAIKLPWVQPNQPVAITVAPNSRGVIDEDKDQLVVDQATRLRQVADFRNLGVEAVRAALLEEGLVRAAPYSNELIAAISDTQCVVVSLSEHPVSGKLVAPSGTVKLFGLNPHVFEGDKFDDQFLEVPGVTVGEFQEDIHWQMDQDLLDSALKRLKKFDEEGPSKSERERIISVLNQALALAQEHPEWSSMKDWLNSYVSRAREHLNSAEEVAVALSDLAPVRDELEALRARAFEQLRNDLEPVVRGEIEKDLSELYDKWDRVEEELEKKQTKLDDTQRNYEDVSDTLKILRQQLLREIADLNDGLGDASEPESENFGDLVERLRESVGSSGALIQPVEKNLPPWARISQSAVMQPIDLSAFTERLSVDAKRVGLGAEDLSSLDIALRSGALTILPQAAAEIMIPAYASAATNGEFVRQPLGPGILSLDDLWNEPVRGVLTGFARGWNEALKNSERYHLIWLDGLQRTPMDVWLPSLTGVLADQRRPKNLLVVASLDAPVLDRDRIWPNLEQNSVPLAPSLSGLRPANLLAGIKGATPRNTVLETSQSEDIDGADFLDYLNEVQEKEPNRVALEADLYQSACLHAAGVTSARDILRQTNALRDSGRSWLKALFEN